MYVYISSSLDRSIWEEISDSLIEKFLSAISRYPLMDLTPIISYHYLPLCLRDPT